MRVQPQPEHDNETREQDPVKWDLEIAQFEFVKAEERIDKGKLKGGVLHLARGMAALCGAYLEAEKEVSVKFEPVTTEGSWGKDPNSEGSPAFADANERHEGRTT